MTSNAFASRLIVACFCGATLAAGGAGSAAAGMLEGASAAQGRGAVAAYAEIGEDGAPRAIGVRFGKGALDGLPEEPNRSGRCFDLDADGELAAHECEGDHEVRLTLPEEITRRGDIPFRWVMLN